MHGIITVPIFFLVWNLAHHRHFIRRWNSSIHCSSILYNNQFSLHPRYQSLKLAADLAKPVHTSTIYHMQIVLLLLRLECHCGGTLGSALHYPFTCAYIFRRCDTDRSSLNIILHPVLIVLTHLIFLYFKTWLSRTMHSAKNTQIYWFMRAKIQMTTPILWTNLIPCTILPVDKLKI